jgi:HK97 family phage portal protein
VPVTVTGAYKALAPQAFAETAPQFYNSYFVPRLGIPLETAFASYGQLYRSQIWIRAAVDKIANSVARLPLHCWHDSKDGKQIDTDSPYAQLLAMPCVTLNNYSFKQWIAAMIEIYGEAYLIKIREGRGDEITSLLPMHPSMTNIRRDQYGELEYQFLGRPNEKFGERDVVPFRLFNPDNTMRGMSRLESLRSTLMTEDSARRSMQAWFQNRMRPSMLIRAKRELGDDGRERLIRALSGQHGGSGNTGRVMVLENDEFEEPTIVQSTADEMQYIQGRELAREEVAAGMDVPLAAMQDTKTSSLLNVVENLRSLYRECVTPRVEFIESVLHYHVGNEFNGPKIAKFDMRAVLRGDWEKRAAGHAQLIQNAAEKPNEAREDLDLPNAGPIGDVLYAQQQIVKLGTPPARPSNSTPSGGQRPTKPPPAQQAATTNGSIAKQKYMRDINGMLGRGYSPQDCAKEMILRTGDIEGVREAFEYIRDGEYIMNGELEELTA